ncbi:MAG: RNA chaperone Hfq [Pyrinomonadaceae bacterium]
MEKHTAQNIQDAFLNTSRRDRTMVSLQLMNGESVSGRIKSFDKFSVMLDVEGSEILIFKHAIATISTEKKKTNFG